VLEADEREIVIGPSRECGDSDTEDVSAEGENPEADELKLDR
jgi:hypothetical protein